MHTAEHPPVLVDHQPLKQSAEHSAAEAASDLSTELPPHPVSAIAMTRSRLIDHAADARATS